MMGVPKPVWIKPPIRIAHLDVIGIAPFSP